MSGDKKASLIPPPLARAQSNRKPTLLGVPAPTSALPKGLFSQTDAARVPVPTPPHRPRMIPAPPAAAKILRHPVIQEPSIELDSTISEEETTVSAAVHVEQAFADTSDAKIPEPSKPNVASESSPSSSKSTSRFVRRVTIGAIAVCGLSLIVVTLILSFIREPESEEVATPVGAPVPAAAPSAAAPSAAAPNIEPAPPARPSEASSSSADLRSADMLQIGPIPDWIARMTPRQRRRRSREVLRHAMRLEARGDVAGAEVWYRRAQHLRPEQSAIASQFAANLQSQNRHAEAVAWAQHAIELAPHLATPYYMLGRVLEREGHREEAIALYHQAHERNPNEVRVLRRLRYLGER